MVDPVADLLASLRPDDLLPDPTERRRLRKIQRPRITQTAVAAALGVTTRTVSAWESGQWEPEGETRQKYRRLLNGFRTALNAAAPETPPAPTTAGRRSTSTPFEDATADLDVAGRLVVAQDAPCALCGQPTPYRADGRPQHPYAVCTRHPRPTHTMQADGPAATPIDPTEPAEPAWASSRRATDPTPLGEAAVWADAADELRAAVRAAIEKTGGDQDAATTALVRRAIPDGMKLLQKVRSTGRYSIIARPPLPTDLFSKSSKDSADLIWEARPKWRRQTLPPGRYEIAELDTNAAYLNAMTAWLPIGNLTHRDGPLNPRALDGTKDDGTRLRRSGVYRITPPDWPHRNLPNPMGARETPGPVWVTDPTLRLMIRLAGPKYRLCEMPEIHESWTSGATEGLLKKFRDVIRDVRSEAIGNQDSVTVEYLKSMYSKIVSTMGHSSSNREIRRPDWMHIIRSQAFANLWVRAYKAHAAGLIVMKVDGTDELHVTGGDWRKVFAEGRALSQMKIKGTRIVEVG